MLILLDLSWICGEFLMWLQIYLPTGPIIVWAVGCQWSTNHWWSGFWTFVCRVRLHWHGDCLVLQIAIYNFLRGDIFWEVSPPDFLWHSRLACVLFPSIWWRPYQMLWWWFCLLYLQLGVQKYSWCRNHMQQNNFFPSRDISRNSPLASVYSVPCCLSANTA